MPKYPAELASLIAYLKKMPGVGIKTAERFAFEFLTWQDKELSSFAKTLASLPETVPKCPDCGCLKEIDRCSFCAEGRINTSLCILASPKDAYAIEETKSYKGLYHVVEHLLSPLHNRYASALRIDRIVERIEKNPIEEVIIAFDSTLEGDTTALFLKSHLKRFPRIKVTRLAFGLPVGHSLEYVDEGTLLRAFSHRLAFE